MKRLPTIGIAVSLFLLTMGCAHAPDSSVSTPKVQETATAQPPAAQATVQPTVQTTAASTAAPQDGKPAMVLSETFFDFGLVSEGNDYIHAFKIRNTGTGTLEIRKIMPG